MRSDAQKRADAKYKSSRTSRLMVEFNKTTDADILKKLDAVPNKAGYIKKLIRSDLASSS